MTISAPSSAARLARGSPSAPSSPSPTIVNHGACVISPRVLLLGGTSEANALAKHLAQAGIKAVYSYAGRVSAPRAQPLPVRSGGFGGVAGLVAYLQANDISHIVDATHPFALGMSRNALAASTAAGLPLVALTRAPWVAETGDSWLQVPDMAQAAHAIGARPARVFLAIGRQSLSAFTDPAHSYLLRLVDPPGTNVDLPPNAIVEIARGPFDVAGDLALLRKHRIDTLVSKNSGGSGARAKLDAARALDLRVIMVDRPALPDRIALHDPGDVLRWLGHADLGV